jgi:hypothetical protein
MVTVSILKEAPYLKIYDAYYTYCLYYSLGGNKIGAAGAEAIAEGCKSCPNLQSIK